MVPGVAPIREAQVGPRGLATDGARQGRLRLVDQADTEGLLVDDFPAVEGLPVIVNKSTELRLERPEILGRDRELSSQARDLDLAEHRGESLSQPLRLGLHEALVGVEGLEAVVAEDHDGAVVSDPVQELAEQLVGLLVCIRQRVLVLAELVPEAVPEAICGVVGDGRHLRLVRAQGVDEDVAVDAAPEEVQGDEALVVVRMLQPLAQLPGGDLPQGGEPQAVGDSRQGEAPGRSGLDAPALHAVAELELLDEGQLGRMGLRGWRQPGGHDEAVHLPRRVGHEPLVDADAEALALGDVPEARDEGVVSVDVEAVDAVVARGLAAGDGGPQQRREHRLHRAQRPAAALRRETGEGGQVHLVDAVEGRAVDPHDEEPGGPGPGRRKEHGAKEQCDRNGRHPGPRPGANEEAEDRAEAGGSEQSETEPGHRLIEEPGVRRPQDDAEERPGDGGEAGRGEGGPQSHSNLPGSNSSQKCQSSG